MVKEGLLMENKEPTQEEVIKLLEIFSEEKDSDGVDRLAKMALKVINDLRQQVSGYAADQEVWMSGYQGSQKEIEKLESTVEAVSGERDKYKGLYEEMYRKYSEVSDKEYNIKAVKEDRDSYLNKCLGLQKQLDDEKKLHELAKAFHNEKCAEFDSLCYEHNKLLADMGSLAESNKKKDKDISDMSMIIKAHKYCVGPVHCQNCSDREEKLAERVKELEEENTVLANRLAEVPDPFPCKVGSGCEAAGSGCYTCPNNRYRQYDQKVWVQKILSEMKTWVLLHGKDKTTDSFGERGLLFFEAFGKMFEEFKKRYEVEE